MKYRVLLLAILTAILTFNYVDRLALGLMLQEIKLDLSLSDTELGLLTGLAFALFYSFMGIPLARWADRGNRIAIITLTATIWSVMVALCGVATSFAQLLVIRVGVAVGEAGCIPPAHSLIAEYFDRSERPRAMARYMLGGPLSCVIGYFVAGWLNERLGWRITFIILGAPGLLLAAVAWFSLDEPRQSARIAGALEKEAPRAQPGLKEVCLSLWPNRAFRHIAVALSLLSFFNLGAGSWQPTFFIRSFGLQSGELGLWLTVLFGLGGLLGTYLGGEWAGRYAGKDEPRQLKVAAVALGVSGLILPLVYLSAHSVASLSYLGVAVVMQAMTGGPLFATVQTLVPRHLRAMSVAVIYLFSNLIGMGLGPLAVGALSDAFQPWFAEESLRYSLLCMCPGLVWVAWHLWRASRTVVTEVG